MEPDTISIDAATPIGVVRAQFKTRYAMVSVETGVMSYTGVKAILSIYGGTGSGDLTKFVEFAIEERGEGSRCSQRGIDHHAQRADQDDRQRPSERADDGRDPVAAFS